EQPAVLLPSPGAATGETAIALKTGAFVPGLNLEAARAGGNYLYLPQTLMERGEDHDIARFREMMREAG
ncbi:MAG: hypothetical protein JO035_01675, partial [Betaproteobacteria bacterium]|nr:hypothetical protein [Betaproteobacteria bacterium]